MSSEGNENVTKSDSPKRPPRNNRRSQDLDANTLARDDAPAEGDLPPEDFLPPEVTADEGEEVLTQSDNGEEEGRKLETLSNSDSGTLMIAPPPPARSESYPDGAGDKDSNPPPFTSDLIQHQQVQGTGVIGASDCRCECHGWSGQELPCYNCAMGNNSNPCKRSKPSTTTRPQGPIAVVMSDFLQSGVGVNRPSDDAISTVTTSPKCSLMNNGCLSSTLIDLFVIAALLLILMMVPLGFLHIRLDVWLILGLPIYVVFGGVLISFTDSKKFYISTALCGFSFLLGNLYIWSTKKAVSNPGYQILPWAIYCVAVSIVIVKCNIRCGSALYKIKRAQSQISLSLGGNRS